MAKIKYIEFDGKEHEIEVSNGLTVMEGAIKNKITIRFNQNYYILPVYNYNQFLIGFYHKQHIFF